MLPLQPHSRAHFPRKISGALSILTLLAHFSVSQVAWANPQPAQILQKSWWSRIVSFVKKHDPVQQLVQKHKNHQKKEANKKHNHHNSNRSVAAIQPTPMSQTTPGSTSSTPAPTPTPTQTAPPTSGGNVVITGPDHELGQNPVDSTPPQTSVSTAPMTHPMVATPNTYTITGPGSEQGQPGPAPTPTSMAATPVGGTTITGPPSDSGVTSTVATDTTVSPPPPSDSTVSAPTTTIGPATITGPAMDTKVSGV